jgi:hypothetical protein
MIWLTPNGEYLVQGPAASLPKWAGAIRSPGDPIQPATFYLVTPEGEVSRAYSEPLEYSVDDERGLTNIHAVSGDSLVATHVIDHVSLGVRIERRVEITGLTSVSAETTPTGMWNVIAAYQGDRRA